MSALALALLVLAIGPARRRSCDRRKSAASRQAGRLPQASRRQATSRWPRQRSSRRARVLPSAGSACSAGWSCSGPALGRRTDRPARHRRSARPEVRASPSCFDQDTHEVLFDKNAQAVLPIASMTKLMTALVVVEAGLPLDEVLTITQDDVDTEKGSRSRLRGRHPADARRDAAPGADVVREPRRPRAGPALPGRPERLRRGDERQGARCWA